jgi:hypothetical protein
MHAKCAECGGKIDCDDIICGNCLAEIINKLYFNNQAIPKKGKAKKTIDKRPPDYSQIKHI